MTFFLQKPVMIYFYNSTDFKVFHHSGELYQIVIFRRAIL